MRRNLLFANLLLSLSLFAQTQSVFNYDFNNLVVGNLNGQDSWVTTKFTNTTLDYKIALTASPDSLSNGVTYAGSGANVGVSASRIIDTIFGGTVFNDLSATYLIKYQMKRNYWGLSFGIAADINNDGKVDKTNTNEKAVVFTGISNTSLGGDKLLLPDGTSNVYAAALTNVWSDVEIYMSDLNLGGLLTMRVKPVTSTNFTTVAQAIPMGIDTSTTSNKNPHNWNMLFMHNEGANGTIDNIQIIKNVLIPTNIIESAVHSIIVYPNPASTEVNVAVDANSKLQLMNLQGEGIPFTAVRNQSAFTLQLGHLQSGIYLLSSEINGLKNYQRVVIKK